MEVFVREEAEELDVALVVAVVRFGQAVARGHEQGGAAVFEAAVDVVAQMEEEGVARHGGQAAKEEDGFAADGLHVAAQAFVVVVPGFAADDDVVRHASGGKRQDGEFGGEHQRGVDEMVVVVEPVSAVGSGLRAHDLPTGAVSFQRQYQAVRQVFAAFDGDAGGAGVQKAAFVVEVVATHGDVARVDAVRQPQFVAAVRHAQAPARGVIETEGNGVAVGIRDGKAREKAGKVAAHITAGYPYRHIEDHSAAGGDRYALLHAETVPAGGGADVVRNDRS